MCIREKQPRLLFAYEMPPKTKHALGVVNSNVCGSFPIPSFEGNKYFVSFVDKFTRMTWISLIKFKHEVFARFKKFKIKEDFCRKNKIKENDKCSCELVLHKDGTVKMLRVHVVNVKPFDIVDSFPDHHYDKEGASCVGDIHIC